MPRRVAQELLGGPIALVAGVIALAACPAPATADDGGAFFAGVGIDYQTGPKSQSCRGGLLFASAEAAPGDLTVAAIRYEDSLLGPGIGGFANAGMTLAATLRLRVIGLRTLGDHGIDTWRLRAGPELKLAGGSTLGAYYLRLHDDSPARFDAAGLELSVPLSSEFSAQAGSSYGRWSSRETTAQGTVGGTLRAGARLLLLCEIDVGRNVTTTSPSSSSGGGIGSGLPLAGVLGTKESSAQSQTDRRITSTAQLGVRFLIP